MSIRFATELWLFVCSEIYCYVLNYYTNGEMKKNIELLATVCTSCNL